MIDLQECRKEIDVIDKEILRLFEKRMEVCEDVAEYKIHTGKQVLDPKREQDKLDVLKNQAHGSFNSLGAQELFQQIMAISRKRQYQLLTKNGIDMEKNYEMVDELPLKNVNVVFQGVEGAYSYAAMRAYFPDEINSYHVRTFRAAMEEVAFGKADYAVLPVGRRLIYATHGHIYHVKNLPPLAPGDVLLHGHTHVPAWTEFGQGNLYLNPGSVSIPKENSPHSYMTLEENTMQWKELESSAVFHELTL